MKKTNIYKKRCFKVLKETDIPLCLYEELLLVL